MGTSVTLQDQWAGPASKITFWTSLIILVQTLKPMSVRRKSTLTSTHMMYSHVPTHTHHILKDIPQKIAINKSKMYNKKKRCIRSIKAYFNILHLAFYLCSISFWSCFFACIFDTISFSNLWGQILLNLVWGFQMSYVSQQEFFVRFECWHLSNRSIFCSCSFYLFSLRQRFPISNFSSNHVTV